MKTPDTVIEIGARCLETSHRIALKLTGGRFPKRLLGMTPLELHTTGRKSGRAFSTLLTSPLVDGDRVMLVASKGGHSDHPDWYKNLVANPEIELTIDGRRSPYFARTADAAEKPELWQRITRRARNYEGYQRNTTRDIPVVICTPRPAR
ncbi:MAG: nitroreductase family deazaflavin-dependent oxidoreductase [Microthrixaceae bacterium]|nr:nitroreductase family deazaflavin-dependent oxidoreductase [Microthrixaceae bacterium]